MKKIVLGYETIFHHKFGLLGSNLVILKFASKKQKGHDYFYDDNVWDCNKNMAPSVIT